MDAGTEVPIKNQRKCKYIHSSVFKDLKAISVKDVPLNIDGSIIYKII